MNIDGKYVIKKIAILGMRLVERKLSQQIMTIVKTNELDSENA